MNKSLAVLTRHHAIFIAIALVLAMVAVILVRPKPEVAQRLQDGTVLRLHWAAKGANVTIIEGNPVQKALWRWFGGSNHNWALRRLHISSPTTNDFHTTRGDGMLSFSFTIVQTPQTASDLNAYFRSRYRVEVVNLNGENFTTNMYSGVRPDSSVMFLRTLGPADNKPAAIRFLAKNGTNWETECEFPITALRDFSKIENR